LYRKRVLRYLTTGKTAAAVPLPLSSDGKNTHGKQTPHGKERKKRRAMLSARQREHMAYGKQQAHDKATEKRTSIKPCTVKKKRHCHDNLFAVCKVRAALCRAFLPLPLWHFLFFPLYCTYFNTYIYSLNMTSTTS
jgi:hypothetical protein